MIEDRGRVGSNHEFEAEKAAYVKITKSIKENTVGKL